MANPYPSPYGRASLNPNIGGPIINEPAPKKKHKALIATIIIVIIIIIIIIIIILVTRKSTPAATTGTSTGTKCTANSQCLAPNKVCDITTGNCMVCLANSDCASPNPYCSNNTCVECLNSSQCTSPSTCISGTCCDLTPPVITPGSLTANLSTSSKITGTYTYSQGISSTAVVTIYDVNNMVLYTQPANNVLGNILVTEAETGSVLFPNTTYGVSVLIENPTCGNTANSAIVQVTTVACGNEPGAIVDTGISAVATVTTKLATANNSSGIQITVNYPSNTQSSNAPSPYDIYSGNATFGIIVYTTSGLEPNLAPMVARGLKAQNVNITNPPNYTFVLASPWLKITPVVGTTYYYRIWFEPCPSCVGCTTATCSGSGNGLPSCADSTVPICSNSSTLVCNDTSPPSCPTHSSPVCSGCNIPQCVSFLNAQHSVVATN